VKRKERRMMRKKMQAQPKSPRLVANGDAQGQE
jgi:hypothetical protein